MQIVKTGSLDIKLTENCDLNLLNLRAKTDIEGKNQDT